MNAPQQLHELTEMIRAVEARGESASSPTEAVLPTGWPQVDAFLGAADNRGGGFSGLRRGAVHEWFGPAPAGRNARADAWLPPLCIMTHLAWQVALCGHRNYVVWVGRRCRPNAAVLLRIDEGFDRRLMDRSIFVDAEKELGLWAIDLALRCEAVGAVIADGQGLDMAATRRLQLAAKVSGGLALLARPPREVGHLSAATTRWLVRQVAGTRRAAWTLELLRFKGAAGAVAGEGPRWALEWNRAKSAVRVSADLAHGPAGASVAAPRSAQRTA
jgi:protein ImuA